MDFRRQLRRFYCSKDLLHSGQAVELSPEESRHLKTSIRLKEGDKCLLVDSQGREAVAVIVRFTENLTAELQLLSNISVYAENLLPLRIFQAMPRHSKVEWLIQKGQELGLNEFYPLVTERTTVKIVHEREKAKLERWNKVVREAAKQSGASQLLKIHMPMTFKEAMQTLEPGAEVVIFHPEEANQNFKLWFESLQNRAITRLNLFFGPEGGFSKKEIDLLTQEAQMKKWSLNIVHLGSRILRADTAFISVLSSLRLVHAGKRNHDEP